jgi:50S ribosomal protein L16 3-hydroxylase
MMRLLGGLSPREFLSSFWQRKPLLVRDAVPDFRDPLTPGQFARLACAPDVESRLVIEKGGARPWEVVDGPQDARRLRRLPATHWTLLVQEANRHIPALADLLETFSFIPAWRVDDVMVSFASPGGSVGPHVDSYDVFLLQGRGRRRWQVDPLASPAIRPALDLRVLRRFRARSTWLLEPGDMLYLPPGLAHYGTALEDCFTYSIGFRAPSHLDLVAGYLQQLARSVDPEPRYADPDLIPATHAGEISAAALRRVAGILRREIGAAPDDVARFAGEFLTEPKGAPPQGPRRRVTATSLASRLSAAHALVRNEASRLAFVRRGRGALLFADGRCYQLDPGLAFAAPLLSDRRRISGAELAPHLRRQGFLGLLAALLSAGCLRVVRARRASR